VLGDSGARVVLFERATRIGRARVRARQSLGLVYVEDDPPTGAVAFAELLEPAASPSRAAGGERSLADPLHVGDTGRPKGVPRTHQNHAAGALAHALQCGYEWGERTLGVMPLYHTMGIHSLTSVAAVNGAFVCQRDWSAAGALALIARERLGALYLIPTLFYDLVHAPELGPTDVTSVRKARLRGRPHAGAADRGCVKAFSPDVFVNHYGSTEIYTFSVRPDVHLKPGCAGRPGLHSTLRVSRVDRAPGRTRRGRGRRRPGRDHRGAWIRTRRSPGTGTGPTSTPKRCARGWYFTGDMVTSTATASSTSRGRVDGHDHQRRREHPPRRGRKEVLARLAGVRDVGVVGEPDGRWASGWWPSSSRRTPS